MSMKTNNTKSTTDGIGILGVLQIVFIVLKLCGLIDWTWKVVLIPVWIELGLLGVILVILLAHIWKTHKFEGK